MNDRTAGLIQTITDRLRETLSEEKQILATGNLLFELVLAIHKAQRLRNPRSTQLRHRIQHARSESHLTFSIENVEAVDYHDNLAELRRIGGQNFIGARFPFVSEINGEALRIGVVSLNLLIRGPENDGETEEQAADRVARERARLIRAYIGPTVLRQRTFAIDWDQSCVQTTSDRQLVLELIDDVYNMHEMMPARLTVSLEPIAAENYVTETNNNRHKRKSAADESATTTAREDEEERCVGYSVHFVGVPTFDDNFFTHLAHKYASRWLNAVVIFPHERVGRLMPPSLVVTLACSNAVAKEAQVFAIVGAKRLCKKLFAVQATDESTASVY